MISVPLFIAFALMTALAALAVLWPLGRARAAKDEREADLAVYRDQLAEITRDRASGRLPQEQAEAARAEVARRMLAIAAAPSADDARSPRATFRRRAAAVVALVALPLMAAAVYGLLGSPQLPGAPLAQRLSAPPDRNDIAILVRRVEEHLARNPDDGQGYEILAPIYLNLGRADDAARAYAQAIRVLGPTAGRHSALGEALVVGSDGLVTADAARAFAAAAALDPAEPRANYFLGLAAEQDGRAGEAARIWGAMVERAPPGASYLPMVKAALARVQADGAPASDAPVAPGPSAADVANAAAMSADDRNAMVRGMVSRLEERLKAAPDDLDGWLRLARAFTVLGEKDKAKGALQSAREAFAGNSEALARIDAAEKDLALGG